MHRYFSALRALVKPDRDVSSNTGGEIPVLPEEILDRIFANLEPAIGPNSSTRRTTDAHPLSADELRCKTLALICRASKTFHRIAYPHLYRTLQLRGFKNGNRLLLRSLLDNPKLSREVLRINASRTSWGSISRKKRPEVMPSDEQINLAAAQVLKTLPLYPATRAWILKCVKTEQEDGGITCVIAICPWVKVLDWPVMDHMRLTQITGIIDAVHNVALRSACRTSDLQRSSSKQCETMPLPFSCIKKLTLTSGKNSYRSLHFLSVDYIMRFLLLPNLTHLHTDGVNLISDKVSASSLRGPFHMREVYLGYTDVHAAAL